MLWEVKLKDGTRFIGEHGFLDVLLREGFLETSYRVVESDTVAPGTRINCQIGSVLYRVPVRGTKAR